MDATTLGMLGVIAALIVGAVVVWRMIRTVSRERLMRCPETEAITLVGVEHGGDGAPVVRRCALWPERAECAQRCLERCEETSSSFPVNLSALRPFGPR